MVIDVLANRFKKEGGFDVVVLSYMNRGVTQSIDTTVDDLWPLVVALRPAYEHVTFIGHSMGGLVGAEMLRRDEGLFDAYVSIASPHSGVALGALGALWGPLEAFVARITPSGLEMAWGSEFVKRENKWVHKKPALTLQASFDELVFPSRSTRLSKNVEHVKIPRTDHLTVATSERTFWEIWGWLIYEVFNETGKNDVIGLKSKVSLTKKGS